MLAWWRRDWFQGYVNVSVSKKKNEGVNHSLKVPLSQADLVRHHHRQVLENQGCQATHGHQGYQVYHRIQHHLFLPFVQEYRKYRNLLCHLQKQAISNQSMWCWILFKKHQIWGKFSHDITAFPPLISTTSFSPGPTLGSINSRDAVSAWPAIQTFLSPRTGWSWISPHAVHTVSRRSWRSTDTLGTFRSLCAVATRQTIVTRPSWDGQTRFTLQAGFSFGSTEAWVARTTLQPR